MLRSLALLAALTLAGCASGEADVPTEPLAPEAPAAAGAAAPDAVAPAASGDHGTSGLTGPTVYTCADGGSFTVAPLGGGAVELALDGEAPEVLQAAPEKQGVYGDGTLELWIAAEGAFVVQDGTFTLTDCTESVDA